MAHVPDAMLSTVDNPYNPYTHWDEWLAWDSQAGYYTPGLLARYIITSPELSDEDQDAAVEMAMDQIIKENPMGVSVKVYKKDLE